MKTIPLSCLRRFAAFAALTVPLRAATVTWDNGDSTSTNTWSVAANWDSAEPTSADDVVFPAGLAATITLGTGENAKTLTLNDAYTLTGGGLTIAAGASATVPAGVTGTINTPLTTTAGLSKLGDGRLTLGGSNTGLAGGVTVNAGTLRVTNANALGPVAGTNTVMGGTTLEVGVASLARNLSLRDGSTLLGVTSTASSNGIMTIEASAASITLGTLAASDVLSLGDTANDFTGGTASTVVSLSGPGAVRMAAASNFDGTWNIPAGTRLELANATAAGDTVASGLTLSGGTLAGRGSALNFAASQAGNLSVTADSTLLSDRASATSGVTHTFGTLNIGPQTLTIAPGANATSGTAGITLGNITLTGNPTFAVNDAGATGGKLTSGSLLGGGVARTVTKTGAGDMSITGGATDLVTGSQLNASGNGTIEFLFPAFAAGATISPTAAQNPAGEASVSVIGGALRLLANGDGTTSAQSIVLPNAFTLGGTIVLDPQFRSAGSNKTFELPGLTLEAGTTLTMTGDNGYALRLTAPLTLNGSATIQGDSVTSKAGLLTLNGGITGGAGTDTLTLLGGTSPLTVTLNAASSFPGATAVNGATVTANAAAAFGSGETTVSGGSLTLNTDGALTGTATITGGTLRVNGADILSANPVALNGGTLDLRSNSAATFSSGPLTLGGNATINVANNGSGGTQLITLPAINADGNRTLTLTNANSYIPLIPSVALAGDLTISNAISARVGGISEDASPRRLLKAGAGILQLQAAGTHSGGTEVLAGTVQAEHAGALGTGTAVLGDTSGALNATLRLAGGQTFENDLLVRAGSSGSATLSPLPPGGTVLNGDITLQRGFTLDNSTAGPLTLNGRISGAFDITRTGSGQIILTNPLNDFGTGGTAALNISGGKVSVGADAPLGNGGITIGASGTLHVTESFATSRTLTIAAGGNLEVDATKTLILNTALAGDNSFDKTGTGRLAFGPGVVSTRTAAMNLNAGTLQLTGAEGLGAASPINMSNGTTLELLNDTNTVYAHPVTANVSGSITVFTGRAEGGSATGGTHTIGPVTLGTGSLTHTSANGFGLTTGAVSTTGSATVTNDAGGLLTIPSFSLGGTSTTARTLTVEANTSDIRVTGALTQTGTPVYHLNKRGAQTLKLESGLGLTGNVTVAGGTLDLNHTSNTLGGTLTLGGENPASTVLLQSGTSTLTLGGDVTASSSFNPPTMTIAGSALDVGGTDRTFFVNTSTAPGADLEITSAITGSGGIKKDSAGVLKLSGTTANTFSGVTLVEQGRLELSKTGAHAVSTGGLTISSQGAASALLLAPDQIPGGTPVIVQANSGTAELDLNGFTDNAGALTVRSLTTSGALLSTGASGTLVMEGNITLENNRSTFTNNAREVLITGTGDEFTASTTGTLDLGGAVRTIAVTTTVVGANEPYANATIETCITNGGIRKTGARTLYLTNPHNNFTGGVIIEEGEVNTGGTGSLGSGGVTLANTGAANAVLNLGSAGGTWPHAVTLAGGGTGCATLRYEGFSGSTMIFPHPLDLSAQGLCVDVVEGTNAPDDGAVLELTGTITDGASAFGLTKEGGGILKLLPGNSHTGTTVNLGVLHVTADSALGDSSGALTVNGGCFHAAGTMSLTRDFIFGANGGCIRVEQPSAMPRDVLTIPSLTWGGAEMGFFGAGQAILAATSGVSSANVVVGAQTDFGRDEFWVTPESGFLLSLRGTAQLPSGNLKLTNRSVLELGTGDFTRAVGTGPGEVQLPTSRAAGWAAFDADRAVNLGGAGALLVWGNTSAAAPFLADPASATTARGGLILGSETATHTVDFQNDLELYDGQGTGEFRTIQVPDGPAALEARISGDITYTPPVPDADASLEFDVTGALHVSGNLSGPLDLYIYSPGTVTLSGTNSHTGWLEAGEGGTIIIASDASAGTAESIYVDVAGHINASAMTVPVVLPSTSYTGIEGQWSGSVTTSGYIEGGGTITGNLLVNAGTDPFDGIEPWSWNGITPLSIGGDFNLAAGAMFWAWADGVVANDEYSQISVTGAVTIAGTLDIEFEPIVPPQAGDAYAIILNAGSDPVSGTFAGLPEGASIAMPGGYSATITYAGNADGGPVGNDVVITVTTVPPPPVEGEIPLTNVATDPLTGQISGSMTTETGVDYVVEKSSDMVTWSTVETFTGDGSPRTVLGTTPAPAREFLRVRKL